ncbi:MAG: M23 family metallopeptidase [Spirochaetaceae bacterium]|nr:M23 family metallopeptidase [Spirochaetaceae bacterium]
MFFKNSSKKLLAFILLAAVLYACVARVKVSKGPEFYFMAEYQEESAPGDIVYLTVTVGKLSDGTLILPGDPHIKLIRNSTGKSPGETDLYLVNDSLGVLFGAIPLSTWLEKGEFTLVYTYKDTAGTSHEENYPIVVNPKEFINEDIPLNATNTAIRTDTSSTKVAQIDRLNEVLGKVNADTNYYDGCFIQPVDSQRRTSFFGDRRTYVYNTGTRSVSEHYGIDFGVPTGTPVKACGSGKVVLAENRISTGWSIVIEHLPGLYSLYYHMDSLVAKEGDIVKQGDLIGKSGATGLATGPHLHWEIRLRGSAVNPDYFKEIQLFRP